MPKLDALFSCGTPVRVKHRAGPGHIRTPHYLRGKAGTVERVLGPFGNPEQLAYGHTPDRLPLYRVRFRMADVWGAAEAEADPLDAEIYAHWLEPLGCPTIITTMTMTTTTMTTTTMTGMTIRASPPPATPTATIRTRASATGRPWRSPSVN